MSVPLEYVFILIITATFFGVFLLIVNAYATNVNQNVVGQELGIVANDIANRIAEFSNKINLYGYNSDNWTSNVTGYSEAIDLPELAQGQQYSIEIRYHESSKTGDVTVFYGSNVNINRTALFRSGTKVANTTIAITDPGPKVCYYLDNRMITVVKY